MAITWKFGSDNTVVIKFLGRVKYDDIIAFLDNIKQESKDYSEIYELVLFSEDIEVDLTSETTELVADKLKDNLSHHSSGGMALVCSTDYIFGLCRQLGMRVEKEALPVEVFRSEEAAQEWFNDIRSLDIA